jgi:hypothetical protein
MSKAAWKRAAFLRLGARVVRVATTVRTASSGAPWRPRGANPPRPGRGGCPGRNGRGFRRFGALVFEVPPHDRPMTSAPRGGTLRIAPGQTPMKTQDLGQTRKDPDGL